MTIRLSEHFTLHEFTHSDTADKMAIDNTPNGVVLSNVQRLCVECLEPLRIALGRPIAILSGYRSMELNEAVKGSEDSQHILGMAADIVVPKMSATDLFDFIRASSIPYDQLINEFDKWVHISYKIPPRRQKYIASKDKDNRTIYHEWRQVA